MMERTSHQEVGRPAPKPDSGPGPQTSGKGRRASLSPEELEKARSRGRMKYAMRMARDPQGYRAKRREIQKRYNQRRRKRPGVQVDLVFTGDGR